MKFPADVIEKARAKEEADRRALLMVKAVGVGLPEMMKRNKSDIEQLTSKICKKTAKPRQPTKTEQQARQLMLATGRYREVRHNAIALILKAGKRYTPDLVCEPIEPGAKWMLCEVKGSYRYPSLNRAELAYAQARLDFPCFDFCWMVKGKDKSWKVTA